MKTSNRRSLWIDGVARAIGREFVTIATSYSIILVLLGGVVLYGFLYNYMYLPNLVHKVPVAVVDMSRSALSRSYTRLIDAAPQVRVVSNNSDWPRARESMKTNRTEAIVYLPHDFETRIRRGEKSIFITYISPAELLNLEAIQAAALGAMQELNADTRSDMLVFLDQNERRILSTVEPVSVVGTALFNPTKGYGHYLLPAVLITIIFQTLLMTIGMISGGERHDKRLAAYATRPTLGQASAIVTGKTIVYATLYALFALFLLGLLPRLFNLPDTGTPVDIAIMMTPYLLATSFFGLAASVFFSDSDSPLLMIAFFSVGLIFLSGVSYPLELMPWYWQALHYLIPAAPATLAFVKMNSMDASLADVNVEYATLWIQCAVYFLLACAAYRRNIRLATAATKKAKTE